MSRLTLPSIPSIELPPRMRLAQKLRAAVSNGGNINDRKGELYEVEVGLRLQQFGWLRAGYQIGRDRLSDLETDQKIYVGNREIDALLRQGYDRRWLIGQAKLPEQGGAQIREAIEFTLVDQVDSANTGRNAQLAGLVYAEPVNSVDKLKRKVSENLIKLLDEKEFSAATGCTSEHIQRALDLNCRTAGFSVNEAKSKLDSSVRKYKDFAASPEYRQEMFNDVRRLLGVTLTVINPMFGSGDDLLRIELSPELEALEGGVDVAEQTSSSEIAGSTESEHR